MEQSNQQVILTNPMPTLEEAKELASKFKRPLNGYLVVLSPLIPAIKVLNGNILRLDAATQKTLQKESNIEKGVLVVSSPFKKGGEEVTNINAVFEGERVVFGPNTVLEVGQVATSEELVEGLEQDVIKTDVERASTQKLKTNSEDYYRKYNILLIRSTDLVSVVN